MDPDRIKGYIGPAPQPIDTTRDRSVNPEEFKKILKVEESTDAEKRQKKKLKQAEEEAESEEEKKSKEPVVAPVVETSFQEVFLDKTPDSGVFSVDGASKTTSISTPASPAALDRIQASGPGLGKKIFGADLQFEEQEPLPTFEPPETQATFDTITASSSPTTALPPPEDLSTPPPSTIETTASPSTTFTPPAPLQPATTSPATSATPITAADESTKKKSSKKPFVDTSLFAQKEKKAPSFKEKKLAEKYESTPATLPKPKAKEQAPTPGEKSTVATPKTPVESSPAAAAAVYQAMPSDIRSDKKARGTTSATRESNEVEEATAPSAGLSLSADTGGGSKDHGGGKNKEKEGAAAPIDLSSSVQINPLFDMSIPPAPPASAASRLSEQVYALFEKMVGLIQVQRSTGVTTTTVHITMSGSVFDGSELVIKQFGSNKNSFDVQLQGSPEAVALFNDNITDLVAALKAKEFTFEVRVQRPVLKGRFRAVRKKEDAKEGF